TDRPTGPYETLEPVLYTGPVPPRTPPVRNLEDERYRQSSQGQRESRIAAHKQWVIGQTRIEKRSLASGIEHWGVSDAPLLGDISSGSFDQSFAHLLPPGTENLKTYIEGELAPLHNRLLLELGGTAIGLRSGFQKGFFVRHAGVTLTDYRQAKTEPELLIPRDAAANRTIITGDMFDEGVHAKVEAWRNGEQLALVVQRTLGGSAGVILEPFTLARNAAHWYNRLAEGGLLMSEIQYEIHQFVERWAQLVHRAYPAIDMKFSESALIIHKRPGSPAHLPLISGRALLAWQRTQRRRS
ncbi:MAG TPA: hypothetical protein VD735_04190, partial [Candidatus Saccharimonadales bacterium]|nr:hypothetical protein [Candidatus Saccharimonadales bacterium]